MNNHFYELQIEIETSCLLNCIHCSSAISRKSGIRKYSDTALLNFISLFQNKSHIYFTGGEPLLNNNLFALSNKITTLFPSIHVGLYTSGNQFELTPISENLAIKMYQSNIKDCYFSIYSDVEHEHDLWTATKGSFKNTLESISQTMKNGIEAKAHLVLNRFNKNKLEQIIEFCQTLEMKEVRILKLTPSGTAKENWNSIGVSLDEQNQLIEQLILKQKEFSTKLSFSGVPHLFPCRSFINSYGCQAGNHLLYVNSSGDIYPCACTQQNPSKFKICNIHDLAQIKKYISEANYHSYNQTCLNDTAYY